jgi:hypothetical protein
MFISLFTYNLFNTLETRLFCELQKVAPNQFYRKSLICRVQKQPLDNRALRKTNREQCEATYRYELDNGHGRAESDVECNSA